MRLAALAVSLAVTATTMTPSAWALDPAEGPVVLTVHGAVTETNRGAIDEFTDAFLVYQGVEFEAAAEFDRAALEALGMVEVETRAPNWPASHTFRGPRLADVLDAAGAGGSVVTPVALDGYAADIPWDDVRRHEPVLALEADGEPLGLGGRGPLWLVFPPEAVEAMEAEDDAPWVWAVVHIEVR